MIQAPAKMFGAFVGAKKNEYFELFIMVREKVPRAASKAQFSMSFRTERSGVKNLGGIKAYFAANKIPHFVRNDSITCWKNNWGVKRTVPYNFIANPLISSIIEIAWKENLFLRKIGFLGKTQHSVIRRQWRFVKIASLLAFAESFSYTF